MDSDDDYTPDSIQQARKSQRMHVGLRINVKGVAKIDKRASQRGVSRSDVIRTMLRYADAHMTEADWNAES